MEKLKTEKPKTEKTRTAQEILEAAKKAQVEATAKKRERVSVKKGWQDSERQNDKKITLEINKILGEKNEIQEVYEAWKREVEDYRAKKIQLVPEFMQAGKELLAKLTGLEGKLKELKNKYSKPQEDQEVLDLAREDAEKENVVFDNNKKEEQQRRESELLAEKRKAEWEDEYFSKIAEFQRRIVSLQENRNKNFQERREATATLEEVEKALRAVFQEIELLFSIDDEDRRTKIDEFLKEKEASLVILEKFRANLKTPRYVINHLSEDPKYSYSVKEYEQDWRTLIKLVPDVSFWQKAYKNDLAKIGNLMQKNFKLLLRAEELNEFLKSDRMGEYLRTERDNILWDIKYYSNPSQEIAQSSRFAEVVGFLKQMALELEEREEIRKRDIERAREIEERKNRDREAIKKREMGGLWR